MLSLAPDVIFFAKIWTMPSLLKKTYYRDIFGSPDELFECPISVLCYDDKLAADRDEYVVSEIC